MTRMPGMWCLILAACVAVLAAGCTAATSKPATTSKPAADSKPATAHGSATGSAVAADPGASPEQIARIQAAALLADFVPPPGARRLAAAPAIDGGALDQPSSVIISNAELDQVTFWVAPGKPQALLAWEQAHLPRSFTPAVSVSVPPSWDQMFSLAPVASVITNAVLVLKVASAGGGQTGIRVDAEVTWQPPRPVSTFVPAAARVVTLSEVALIVQPSPLPKPVTITSDGVVRQLAAIVNRLQLSTAGAVSCGGGIGNALRLTFRARPGGPPLAVAEGPWSCGSVRLTINGKEQPALQLTDSFIGDVLRAAGLNWRVVP